MQNSVETLLKHATRNFYIVPRSKTKFLVNYKLQNYTILMKSTKKGKTFFNAPSGVIMPFSYHSIRLDNTFSYSGRVGL